MNLDSYIKLLNFVHDNLMKLGKILNIFQYS